MDEVRVNIGGAEMELRPVSARQYLAARVEAEKMAESFADDTVTNAVLFGAALLAKGLFYDGERIFSDGNEVLDAFSADEIADTAVYIDLESEQKFRIVEINERLKSIEQESKFAEQEINAIGESNINKNNNYADGIYAKANRISEKENTGIFSAYSNTSVRRETESFKKSYSPRSDMRRVSDFFQRDSRRYDGTITSY